MIKTNEELYEILGDVNKFNIFINALIEKTVQQTLLSVPSLVKHHVENEKKYKQIRDEFFRKNPELVEHKNIVSNEIAKIASDHIDWDIEKIFTQAGIQAKKVIRQLNEEIK